VEIHALAIHAGETKPKVDKLFIEGVDDSLGSNHVAATFALELRAFRRPVALEQLEPIGGIPMSMNIDDAMFRRRHVVSIGRMLGHGIVLRFADGIDPYRRAQIDAGLVWLE
jgi:hypothetical protein